MFTHAAEKFIDTLNAVDKDQKEEKLKAKITEVVLEYAQTLDTILAKTLDNQTRQTEALEQISKDLGRIGHVLAETHKK